MFTRPPEPRDTLSEQPTPACPTPPRYAAEQLFAGARQLIIVHGGREYCLRLTAANKLILTA